MKHLILCLIAISNINICSAQISFVNGPESVEFDATNNRYLASSPSDNKIYSVVKGGTATVFAAGVTSPYGMVYNAGIVYVCVSGGIKGYDVNTAAQVFNVPIAGSSFLNGICIDGSGHLFATDFSAKKIYKIDIASSTVNTFLSTGAKTPNGILWDASAARLVYCTWGTNAGLFAVNMSDSTVASIRTTTYGSFDGVVQDGHHNYYMSSWGLQGILKVDSALSSVTPVVSGLTNPADIFYNVATDTLAVPNSGDSISFHFFGTIDTSHIDSTVHINEAIDAITYFKVLQTNEQLVVKWSVAETNFLELTIHAMNGTTVFSKSLSNDVILDGSTTIDIAAFSSGIYIATLSDGKHQTYSKFSIQK